MMDDFDKLKKKCLDNIDEDRSRTKEFIDALLLEIAAKQTTHSFVGTTLSKYVETMQRSNEQLARLLSMEKKKEKDLPTSEEIESVYDEINDANAKPKKLVRKS